MSAGMIIWEKIMATHTILTLIFGFIGYMSVDWCIDTKREWIQTTLWCFCITGLAHVIVYGLFIIWAT